MLNLRTLSLLSLALAAPSHATFIYGIDDDNVIWEADPAPGEQTFQSAFTTGIDTAVDGFSNAFAFDRNRDQMLFLNRGVPNGTAAGLQENNLWMWNKSNDTISQIATGATIGTAGQATPANAAYYNNAFWFFDEGSFNLNRITLDYTNPLAPTFSARDTFAVTPAPGAASSNAFGDIAIDANNGVLYAYTSATAGGAFYSLDLNTISGATVGGYNSISGGSAVGLQISFDELYDKLYGHDYNTGKWYEINKSTGNLTDLGFTTTLANGFGFRDIAGASALTAVPEPGSSMIFTMLAMGGSAIVNRRRRRA